MKLGKQPDSIPVEEMQLNFKVNRNPMLPLIAIGMWLNWKIVFAVVFVVIFFLES